MNGPEDKQREIIIVKRRGDESEDGHHGGVWKIAFADFMTAMMCFFLVMWLVNAANEQTKAAVASYFNPMSLMEPTPTGSGVDDPGVSPRSPEESNEQTERTTEDDPSNTNAVSGPGQFANSVDSADTQETSDEHLFADPYAVLAEIAAETGTLQNISTRGDGGARESGPATGADGGESYRDPFAPDFWSQEMASEDADLDVFDQDEDADAPAEATEEEAAAEDTPPTASAAETAPAEEAALDPVETFEDLQAGTDQLLPEEPEDQAPSPATALAETIRGEIAGAFGEGSELNQAVSVVETDDGVLISVTDELNYGMFEIGSAVPQTQLVQAMERISESLADQPGQVQINGHTDGRAFQSDEYDNWRLSTARAHAAYYMLVRAGLDEERVKSVAGYADRRLKVPEDPNADANRRIEILLETSG